MRIAYILAPGIVLSGRSNGIRSQVLTWVSALKEMGQEITLVNTWEDYRWEEYDIIHLFGSGGDWSLEFPKRLLKYNSNIVFSPICDDTKISTQKLKTFIGSELFKVWSYPYIRKKSYKYFKAIFVRSDHEAKLITEIYNADKDKIYKVPLSYNKNISPQVCERENFCLHISSIYQQRKNVIRLIEAAKKYNFKLVLAGAKGSEEEYLPIKQAIGNSPNIDVLGFISEEEKFDLYNKAKVFALPSIEEGVGIVALDAAANGCEIVITNIEGPSEYYNDLAFKVNPYSIDDIGEAILKAMNSQNQPKLSNYIKAKYSLDITMQELINYYKQITIS